MIDREEFKEAEQRCEDIEVAVLAVMEDAASQAWTLTDLGEATYDKYSFFSLNEIELAIFRLIGKNQVVINGCGKLVRSN